MRNALSFNIRRALKILGIGAVSTLGTVAVSDAIFAKQFVDQGPSINLPRMVYDAKLQMMIDPVSGQPIYQDATKLSQSLPTVTSACSDCPKRDD